jgi:diguanylate cyclase (GGDEF)-like protein
MVFDYLLHGVFSFRFCYLNENHSKRFVTISQNSWCNHWRSQVEQIRESVLKCLDDIKDEGRLIQALNHIITKEGVASYPVIFHILTHLVMGPEEAEQCWKEIISHHESLSSTLVRDVSLRTAICDYFCSIHKSLKNPKVVEIQIFEKTVKASKYDSLTGLLNRQSFDEALKSEMNRAKRHNKELSILFFDIDDFKKINDSLGHQAGDEALKKVAEIISVEKRAEDIAARYGGEEMVVILPETGKMNALVLGERIRQKVEKMKMKYKGQTIRLTISGGLAAFPINAASSANLLKCADSALYRAKGSGKNNISFFSRDKRRYMRIDLKQDVKVRELGFNEYKTQVAKGKNICVGGILFENDYSMPIGTKVQVNVPTEHGKPLYIIGTVVRVETFGPKQYDIGLSISFLEMDKAMKHEISHWLQVKRQKIQGVIENPDEAA